MRSILKVIKEQIIYFPLIIRLAFYELKGKYQMHYLGVLWQFISPLLQVFVYWFIFGVGIRKGVPVEGTPFIIWLLVGLIPWFFISPTIVQGANSIYNKVNLVSKMKFPVSILPSITIVSNTFNFLVMLIILLLVIFLYDMNVNLYIIQLPYYIICLYALLYSIVIFTSTISVVVRDFQLMIQFLMRMLFFLSPILWSLDTFPEEYRTFIKLNPFVYIINGFRETLLSSGWFFDELKYMFYFWSLVLLLIFIGSNLYENLKKKFVDYL